MAEGDRIAEVARRHGLGEGAIRALRDALVAGGGRQAQFSHPELGGMGQWSAGGMLQIGDMFDDALKSKVGAALEDLAAAPMRDGGSRMEVAGPGGIDTPWPEELGRPSATGSQNDMRYAVFPETRRLAIVDHGRVTVYDTGDAVIIGVSQEASTCSALAFASRSGPVLLDALRVVGSREVGT